MSHVKPLRRPPWIPVRPVGGEGYEDVRRLMRVKALHTVCEEAHCPNISDCWGRHTATFLLLGDTCTRSCKFCNVATGRPAPPDPTEPDRVAEAARAMNLRHVVLTSVDRDDLPDGGAGVFAETIRKLRRVLPECTVEVLIPDFKGSEDALRIVMDAGPDVLNHNVETVPRLFRAVQPQSKYERSLAVLRAAKSMLPGVLSKSGIMVGLGERWDEIVDVMRDLVGVGVDILTIGQYLQPTREHWPIHKYYTPQEFDALRRIGLNIGFKWVESAPLVRSSYHAEEQVRALKS